tara:strand:+ start:3060 stop:3920 length:861 start_codon:yes stop_codon:yes gene_type:complete
MDNLYKIKNTLYLNPSKEYEDKNLYPDFQLRIESFKEQILKSLKLNSSETYLRLGDGDYYFLNKIPKGSAKPGKRALKKPYSKINLEPFSEGFKKNDNYLGLITKDHLTRFKTLIPEGPDFPIEIIYGLIANKWFFQNITKKIGLIGAKPKLKMIEQLLKHDEYKEYLKIEEFNDYIYVDQNFACDNLEKTKKKIFKQLRKSDSDIYLIGVGHVKLGLLHELKKIKPAVYLDIGVGIDALAGIVNIYRPYFGNWKNFQLQKSLQYHKKLDILINNFGSFGDVYTIK